ncbi:MAG: site-specific DNA-methyltransferase [Bacteroidales bacterium]|nr:site-specific DNA-methyltransferase [Bacteroidales bacterium]
MLETAKYDGRKDTTAKGSPKYAGCPPGGVVLDPFFGAGTTGLVARNTERNYIGIELNPDYVKIAGERLSGV